MRSANGLLHSLGDTVAPRYAGLSNRRGRRQTASGSMQRWRRQETGTGCGRYSSGSTDHCGWADTYRSVRLRLSDLAVECRRLRPIKTVSVLLALVTCLTIGVNVLVGVSDETTKRPSFSLPCRLPRAAVFFTALSSASSDVDDWRKQDGGRSAQVSLVAGCQTVSLRRFSIFSSVLSIVSSLLSLIQFSPFVQSVGVFSWQVPYKTVVEITDDNSTRTSDLASWCQQRDVIFCQPMELDCCQGERIIICWWTNKT